MADTYPVYPTLPSDWLVAPEDQPDYLDLPGIILDERVSLGAALSDAHVLAGRGSSPAIIHHESGTVLTFAELAQQSDRVAATLVSHGVTPGARVGVRSENRPEGIISALAIWKIGAVLVPIPHIARSSELAFYFRDTEPAALITNGSDEKLATVVDCARAGGIEHVLGFGAIDLPEDVQPWDDGVLPVSSDSASVSLDSVAVVWHTGGTTGVPKGCYHTQRRFLLAGRSFGLATGSAPGQRWAAAAPIGHALGLIYHSIFTLLHGATIVLIEGFTNSATLLEALESHQVTTFTAVTASWAGMKRAIDQGVAAPPSALRTGYAMWQSSSSSEVSNSWRSWGVELLNNFGSTAFATWVLIPPLGRAVPQAALGSPARGYEIEVVDVDTALPLESGTIGRMRVRGASGLTYWRLPEKQREDVRDGWILVDDLIHEVEPGIFTYLGRTDFLISTSGHKVAPSEVEAVLSGHPAVKEVVVIGLPDPVRHEAVAAFVVVAEHASPTDELRRELQDLVKAELSPFKYPRILEYLDALPRDHVGKVQPKLVRENALKRSEP